MKIHGKKHSSPFFPHISSNERDVLKSEGVVEHDGFCKAGTSWAEGGTRGLHAILQRQTAARETDEFCIGKIAMAVFGRRLRTPALLIQLLVRIHRTSFRKLAAPFHFRKLSCNIEHWVDRDNVYFFRYLSSVLLEP